MFHHQVFRYFKELGINLKQLSWVRPLFFLSSLLPITYLPSPPCYSHIPWYQQTIDISVQFYLWNELKRKMMLASLYTAYPSIPSPTLAAPKDLQKTSPFNLSKCSKSPLPRRGSNSSLGGDEKSCHLAPVSRSPLLRSVNNANNAALHILWEERRYLFFVTFVISSLWNQSIILAWCLLIFGKREDQKSCYEPRKHNEWDNFSCWVYGVTWDISGHECLLSNVYKIFSCTSSREAMQIEIV